MTKNQLNELPTVPPEFKQFKASLQGKDAFWDKGVVGQVKNTAEDFLRRYGFRRLGDGNRAAVFGNPQMPYVIKLFAQDGAYARWVNFIKANPNNKYLPKIRGKLQRLGNFPYYYIRLEKLMPLTSDKQWMDLEERISHIQFIIDQGEDMDAIEATYDPDLIAIAKSFNANESILDLHGGNFMQRADGTVVIVDPFYNYFRGGKYAIPNEH